MNLKLFIYLRKVTYVLAVFERKFDIDVLKPYNTANQIYIITGFVNIGIGDLQLTEVDNNDGV